MYFSNQIRQINFFKKNYRGRPVEEDKERRRRGRRFSTSDKRKERLTCKERLVAAQRGQSWEKRWEAWGSWHAQSRKMRWEEWGTVRETLKTPCLLLKGNLVIANSPPTDISNAYELLTKWTIKAPNIKRMQLFPKSCVLY